MKNIRPHLGFSLIELLIIISIINVLAAVSTVLYLGVRDRAKVSSIVRTAESAKPELEFWLQSSLSNNVNFREVDTNFDGKIDANDKTNGELFNHVAETYVEGRNSALNEFSPWFDVPLWSQDNPPPAGTIGVIQLSPRSLKIIAKGKSGDTVYEQVLTD
jgi:Tfp pilus assembly major pilin PilA